MSQEQKLNNGNATGPTLECLQSLRNKEFIANYFPSGKEALKHILGRIPLDATVGFGDSKTARQIGLPGALLDRGQTLISPVPQFLYEPENFPPDMENPYANPDEKKVTRLAIDALCSDYFISGINAVTMDGNIVNTDRWGNRVAGIVFPQKRVILVAGVNKIVSDIDKALERIQKVAGPLNMRRHLVDDNFGGGTPCSHTGECQDCDPCSVMVYTVIIGHQRPTIQLEGGIEVVLIEETLGL